MAVLLINLFTSSKYFDRDTVVKGLTVLQELLAKLLRDRVVDEEDVDGAFAARVQPLDPLAPRVAPDVLARLPLSHEPVVGSVDLLRLELGLSVVQHVLADRVAIDELVSRRSCALARTCIAVIVRKL